MIKGDVTIGWAHVDITPQRKTLVQGQFYTRISDKIVSPLTATAMAMEVSAADGTTDQAVIVSCDLPQEAFKNDLLSSLANRCPGLDPAKITICCTHTHNAPCQMSGWYDEPADDPDFMPPVEYRLWMAAQVANAVEEAWTKRAPGSIARGFGYAVVARCRRATYADGSAQMYGETDRPDFNGFESCDDHSVNFLFTHNQTGDLTGIILNIGAVSQCTESGEFFSADFWHPVREHVKTKYGPTVHLLPQCAPSGDVSPHLLADKKEEADLRTRMGLDSVGIIGRRIAAALDEALATASTPESEIAFAHRVENMVLPRLRVTREEYELEKRIPHMSDEERNQQHYAFRSLWPFGDVCELVSRYENQDTIPNHEAECHIIRIGDVVFATSPFELFIDYAIRIRCRSRALQTFLVQLGDGSIEGFYLPTRRALAGGHYSAQIKSCWVGPEGGDILVENTVAAINDLFPDANYPKTR
jgi:hypothetical protein